MALHVFIMVMRNVCVSMYPLNRFLLFRGNVDCVGHFLLRLIENIHIPESFEQLIKAMESGDHGITYKRDCFDQSQI